MTIQPATKGQTLDDVYGYMNQGYRVFWTMKMTDENGTLIGMTNNQKHKSSTINRCSEVASLIFTCGCSRNWNFFECLKQEKTTRNDFILRVPVLVSNNEINSGYEAWKANGNK